MFELSIEKQQLLGPLLMVASAVDKKQSLPILSNILLQLQDDRLSLTATDLEIEITARLSCRGEGTQGTITVPTKKIVDIIRSLDDDASPRISFKDDVVTIKVGRSLFKLGTLAAKEYPRHKEEVNELELSIQRTALIQLLQSTHFAMAQQDVRVYLNSLLLEFDTQSMTAVTTDGHRMAVARYFTTLPVSQQRLLIPRKGTQEMLRLLQSITDEEVLLSAGKNHLKIETKDYTFISKLAEARFPVYHKAIPTQQDKMVEVDSVRLKRALSRIVILANEKSKAVVLHVQSGQLTLVANNQEKEEASEILEAKTEGDNLSIGINASYLLDVLNHAADGLLRLSFTTMDSSILVESLADAHYQYVIMPMKL